MFVFPRVEKNFIDIGTNNIGIKIGIKIYVIQTIRK